VLDHNLRNSSMGGSSRDLEDPLSDREYVRDFLDGKRVPPHAASQIGRSNSLPKNASNCDLQQSPQMNANNLLSESIASSQGRSSHPGFRRRTGSTTDHRTRVAVRAPIGSLDDTRVKDRRLPVKPGTQFPLYDDDAETDTDRQDMA
jgi:hypothetical protein